jgi:outer membrane protein TolC
MLLLEGLSSCAKKMEHRVHVVPQQFPSSNSSYVPIANLPSVAWWKEFHDLELDDLITAGLKQNMDIHIAIGNLQQAQGELQQVKLSWLPSLKVLGGYSTNPALGAPGGFYGVIPYYVLNIMQLYAQQKKATQNVGYYQAALSGMRLTVIGQIAAAYFTLMAQQEQLRLLRILGKDLKTLISLSEQDIKIGLSNQIDIAQLRSNELLIVGQTKLILYNIVVSQNALRYLINANPGPIKNKNNFAQLDFSHFKPGSLPIRVLMNRPDMKMAEYALKAAKINIDIAYSNFFPSLQLDDFLGEVHLPNSSFGQATDAYGTWFINPSTFGIVAASKGAYKAKIAEFTKTIRRILKEVDTDYSANKRMKEQYAAFLKSENDYRHTYKLQQGLVQTGLLSYKELLLSKIYLDNLALSTNQAKLELAMSLVVLYQDLASGYNV